MLEAGLVKEDQFLVQNGNVSIFPIDRMNSSILYKQYMISCAFSSTECLSALFLKKNVRVELGYLYSTVPALKRE